MEDGGEGGSGDDVPGLFAVTGGKEVVESKECKKVVENETEGDEAEPE